MSYRAEIDAVDEEQWHHLLSAFDDATIFQTWGYGLARWGRHKLSHAVIRQGDEVVGLAQSVLLGIPGMGNVLAYVNFGPVWQRRSAPKTPEHLRATLRGLRDEYAVRRRLCLRVRPWAHDIREEIQAAMAAEAVAEQRAPLRATYIVDLLRSESALRSAMDKKWRANLRKAEQSGLTVAQENGRDGIRIFADLHGQMRGRKRFSSDFIGMLPALDASLPPGLRPNIFVCRHGSGPVAAAVVSAIGNRAFYLNGATGDAALEVRGGHFLQWAIVRWLKENGSCRWYDLYGAASSPGVQQFKRGLVGARAAEIPMNEFEACESRVSSHLVGAGERLREARRQLQAGLDQLRRRARPPHTARTAGSGASAPH